MSIDSRLTVDAEVARLRAILRGAAEAIDEHVATAAGETPHGYGIEHWAAIMREEAACFAHG